MSNRLDNYYYYLAILCADIEMQDSNVNMEAQKILCYVAACSHPIIAWCPITAAMLLDASLLGVIGDSCVYIIPVVQSIRLKAFSKST